MKAFIASTVVFNLVISSFVHCELTSSDGLSWIGQAGEKVSNVLIPSKCTEEASNGFVYNVSSNLAMVEQASLLKEFIALKKKFAECSDKDEAMLLARDALQLIKKIADTKEVLKNKELRLGFTLFAKKELIFFGFSKIFVNDFIKGLNLEGRYNLCILKARLIAKMGTKFLFVLTIAYGMIIAYVKGDNELAKWLGYSNNTGGLSSNLFKNFYNNVKDKSPVIISRLMPELIVTSNLTSRPVKKDET